LLDGFAALCESGVAVGVPIIRRALEVTSDQPITDEELSWLPIAWIAAAELYDDQVWQALTSRSAVGARMRGTVARGAAPAPLASRQSQSAALSGDNSAERAEFGPR